MSVDALRQQVREAEAELTRRREAARHGDVVYQQQQTLAALQAQLRQAEQQATRDEYDALAGELTQMVETQAAVLAELDTALTPVLTLITRLGSLHAQAGKGLNWLGRLTLEEPALADLRLVTQPRLTPFHPDRVHARISAAWRRGIDEGDRA